MRSSHEAFENVKPLWRSQSMMSLRLPWPQPAIAVHPVAKRAPGIGLKARDEDPLFFGVVGGHNTSKEPKN